MDVGDSSDFINKNAFQDNLEQRISEKFISVVKFDSKHMLWNGVMVHKWNIRTLMYDFRKKRKNSVNQNKKECCNDNLLVSTPQSQEEVFEISNGLNLSIQKNTNEMLPFKWKEVDMLAVITDKTWTFSKTLWWYIHILWVIMSFRTEIPLLIAKVKYLFWCFNDVTVFKEWIEIYFKGNR